MDNKLILERLKLSKFRASFHLKQKDFEYIETKGIETIERHCKDFVAKRLADTSKVVDGKQTPMRGHPAFVAQHATATCCRECLAKWHKIKNDHILTESEQAYILSVIMDWIKAEMDNNKIKIKHCP